MTATTTTTEYGILRTLDSGEDWPARKDHGVIVAVAGAPLYSGDARDWGTIDDILSQDGDAREGAEWINGLRREAEERGEPDPVKWTPAALTGEAAAAVVAAAVEAANAMRAERVSQIGGDYCRACGEQPHGLLAGDARGLYRAAEDVQLTEPDMTEVLRAICGGEAGRVAALLESSRIDAYSVGYALGDDRRPVVAAAERERAALAAAIGEAEREFAADAADYRRERDASR